MTLDVALRIFNAFWALIACVLCGVYLVYGNARDQAREFAVIVTMYAIITVAGQIQSLDRPVTWVTWLLALTVVCSNVVTARYLWKHRRTVVDGGEGGP